MQAKLNLKCVYNHVIKVGFLLCKYLQSRKSTFNFFAFSNQVPSSSQFAPEKFTIPCLRRKITS